MRSTAITFEWGDGERTFDLRLGEIRKIQDKTGVGPGVIISNLQNGTFKVDEYREVILQGLLGGGMESKEATALVKAWVDERPAKESILPALNILMAWYVGVPEGKGMAANSPAETTTAPVESPSPPSMPPEPPLESSQDN